jgi:hypothetical protein
LAKLLRYLAVTAFVALMCLGPGARRAFADPRDFRLVNGTVATTLTQVYVAPTTSDDWEDDVMGADVLVPGDSVNIHFGRFNPDTCMYDIKVVGKDGSTGELDGVDLCSTTTVTFHD